MPAERQCPGCGLDFELRRRADLAAVSRPSSESFADKFKGTEWETPIEAPPTVSPAQPLLPLVIFGLVLCGLTIGLFLAAQAEVLDGRLSEAEIFVVVLVNPFIAGTLSQVIPGRKARGPFKGWLLGWAGSFLAWIAVAFVGPDLSALQIVPGTWGHMVLDLVLAIGATLVLRLILLFFD